MRLLRVSWKWFTEALFPPKCLICHSEGKYLCEKHDTFHIAPPSEVNFQYVDSIFAATHYFSSPARQCVEFFKFRGFREVAEIMTKEMIMKTPTSFFKKTVLVPIPLHWTRKFARGFNQSELMAQTIAKYASLLVSTNLKRIRRTPQQARLSKKEREGNIQHAFVWKGDAIPRNITLIDDVVASGSTLEEAARILKQAGVKKVQAVVFARGGNRNRQ